VKNDSLQLLAVLKTHVNYAHSDNFDKLKLGNDAPANYNDVFNSGLVYPGFGIDFGAVYEWRPHYKDYKYDMDGKTNMWRKDKNKYKLRVGASVLDLGSIKYKKGRYSDDFYIDIDTIKYRILDLTSQPVLGFDEIIDSLAVRKQTSDYYKMSLPTALSLQIDYNIWKTFYISLTPYFSLQQKKRQAKVHDLSVITLAPRWDWKWLGASIPVSYNSFYATAKQPIKVGAMVRLGPIIVGTNDLATYTSGNLFGGNFYFLLKVPIPYGHKRDKDHDGISNKKDKCRNDPGTWEFMGCPDRDHDHVADTEDKCPDVPGLKEFAGCPDKDSDGITDAEDSCPDEKGLAQFKGCPDTDNDNIIDKEDECPLVAGIAEFKGCPDTDADGTQDKDDECVDIFGPKELKGCPDKDADSIVDRLDDCPDIVGPRENKGCPWPDQDKDGIFDKEDDCPQVAGVPELKGCPKQTVQSGPVSANTQTVEMKAAEKKIIEKAFASLEFATAKDVIKPASYPGLNDLAKLMMAHEADWKLKLNVHTDNEGNPEKNMLLSEKRAKAVKNYLMKKGVKDEQVITEWFGQTQPVADNKTPKGRQKNRRVEMKIMLKE
jgi:outer membrane protein OmpA-like peptidoglycan-associated protein